MNKNILFIAEAGVNHNGSMKFAKKLIDIAADAGSDFVKFQSFKTENLVTPKASKASYQKENSTNLGDDQYSMLKNLELSRDDHFILKKHCIKRKIQFLSTAFDEESLSLLLELDVPFLKIPSGELNNLPFLRLMASAKKPIVLSTGMSTLNEINKSLNVLINAGIDKNDITILHCNTAYPTPLIDVNLRAMNTIREEFDISVGFSDHSEGIEASIAAVAMGARIIEKHFTIDKNMKGPDHLSSLSPLEMKKFNTFNKKVTKALGSKIKKPSESEKINIIPSRKSIVAKKDIRKGEILTEKNITTKRPEMEYLHLNGMII